MTQGNNGNGGNSGGSQGGQGGNSGGDQGGQSGGSSERGFAAMDPDKQREIASKGGKAAHESGNAHEFTSEEAVKPARPRTKVGTRTSSPRKKRVRPASTATTMMAAAVGIRAGTAEARAAAIRAAKRS
ncbi:hypothetical protein HNQ07_003556 [Deinococcus metalli]|uniref:General stress protein n=1 Tax=Deinococcus metalli TaxID=1141878 RepID=A0A7W8KH73_9DEIO|nr:KGG domain-containing protein [Deinococcus metalli]MBB5378055.1 hypothetical protein [Deinococcus metalli]GHF54074.1 hypothetical protein GCM10017781_32960 [Deinococcus metalli]